MKKNNKGIYINSNKWKTPKNFNYDKYGYLKVSDKKLKDLVRVSNTWFFGKYGTFLIDEVCYIRCNDDPDTEMVDPPYTVFNWEHKEIGDLSVEEYERLQEQLGDRE